MVDIVTYISNPRQIEGGKREEVVSDDTAQQLLAEIVIELKKINIQLSFITDVIVSTAEAEFIDN